MKENEKIEKVCRNLIDRLQKAGTDVELWYKINFNPRKRTQYELIVFFVYNRDTTNFTWYTDVPIETLDSDFIFDEVSKRIGKRIVDLNNS